MGRKEIEALIEDRLADVAGGTLYDPGNAIGWIDPDGRSWNIVVVLTSNPGGDDA